MAVDEHVAQFDQDSPIRDGIKEKRQETGNEWSDLCFYEQGYGCRLDTMLVTVGSLD